MIEQIKPYLFSLVAALIALTVHEFCHGYTAYKLGDNTARNLGRLSLNPLHHLDIFGVICMVLFHFGWAKPVPINARNFKNPKRDFALTAVAGPISNILIAFLATPLFLSCFYLTGIKTDSVFIQSLIINTINFFQYFVIINLGLGVFNLIPLPPFDGSRIINVLLPERLYFRIMKYERKIYLCVLIWLFFGKYVYSALCLLPFVASNAILLTAFRVFDLSSLISDAVGYLYQIFFNFWKLIIF